MLSYMQLTLEINYDPNRHPQLELDATNRHFHFLGVPKLMCGHD